MIQRSRKPAAAVLVASILAAGAYTWSTGAGATGNPVTPLAELERAIADPNASLATWLLYAQRLQQEQRFSHAALAYQRVLEDDPYSRAVSLQCANALALAGDADRYHGFLSDLLLIDPRLTQDILSRPESHPFMAAERFQTLLQQARAQAMD